MNCSILLMTLESISSDSSKNSTLKNIISSVSELVWSDISRIIGCYCSDSSKTEAISIIVSKKEIQGCVSIFLPQILFEISSDSSKITALQILKNYICSVSGSTVIKILEYISSDSSKVHAVSIVAPFMITTNGSIIETLLSEILSDSSKINALNIIIHKISKISGPEALNALQNISSDSSKVQCTDLIASKMEINLRNLITILNEISSDSSRLSALKIFIRSGLKVNQDQLFDICNTINSNSSKVDAILAFDNFTEPISDHEKYCEKLATTIDDLDQYLKVAKKLKLNEDFVQKHKPEKKNISIFSTFTNGVSDFNDRPGVYCVNTTTCISGTVKTIRRTYSDGSVYETVTHY